MRSYAPAHPPANPGRQSDQTACALALAKLRCRQKKDRRSRSSSANLTSLNRKHHVVSIRSPLPPRPEAPPASRPVASRSARRRIPQWPLVCPRSSGAPLLQALHAPVTLSYSWEGIGRRTILHAQSVRRGFVGVVLGRSGSLSLATAVILFWLAWTIASKDTRAAFDFPFLASDRAEDLYLTTLKVGSRRPTAFRLPA